MAPARTHVVAEQQQRTVAAADYDQLRQRVTALFEAVRSGDVKALEKSVKKFRGQASASEVVVDTKDANKRTLLHFAAHFGHSKVCSKIIQLGGTSAESNLLSAVDGDGFTPFCLAARAGHVRIVELLGGRRGISVNVMAQGQTPLHRAARSGEVDMVDALLGLGAEPNTCGRDGLGPLHVAAGGNHRAVAERLIAAGASVCATSASGDGLTPLMIAVVRGAADVALLLLEKEGATALLRDTMSGGLTPLAVAAESGHERIVAALVSLPEGAATANVASDAGVLPIELAATSGERAIVAMLAPLSDCAGRASFEGTALDELLERLAVSAKAKLSKSADELQEESAVVPPALAPAESPAETGNDAPMHRWLALNEDERAATRGRSDQLKDEGNRAFVGADLVAAVDAYTRAIELCPVNENALVNRSACYVRLSASMDDGSEEKTRKLKLALEDANAAVAARPDWSKAYYRRGMAYQAMMSFEEAAVAIFEGMKLTEPGSKEERQYHRCFTKAVELGKEAHASTVAAESTIS